MTDSLWRTSRVPNDGVERLMRRHALPRRVATWACLYGLDEDSFPSWTAPEQLDWSSPWKFRDMALAVQRIAQAIRNQERVVVVGDYDVDGVCAATILCETLQALGADWVCVLPHRVEDGYGLTNALVDRAKNLGAGLVVTVDNGIVAVDAVQYAKAANLDVIITDHHNPGPELPAAASAVVHWAHSDDPEALALLSGAAVAWKLSQALLERAGSAVAQQDGWRTDWHIGLAALAAQADVMPMVGENRKLVRLGIRLLATVQRPGWTALCRQAQVDPGRLTETTVLWQITPRLNAAGRMDSAELALQLLMATEDDLAAGLAAKLEALNQERRMRTDVAVHEAVAAYAAVPEWAEAAAVVVHGQWPLGVVGIVAAKLAEQLNKPAIVFADDGGSLLKGSGRAPAEFPLHAALSACGDWLTQFGGHDAAVGCTVQRAHLRDFQQSFVRSCELLRETAAHVPRLDSEPSPLADDWLSLKEADLALLQWLEGFRPFGAEAPELTFLIGPLRLQSATPLSNGKHVRLRVQEDDHVRELMWFNVPSEADRLQDGMTFLAVVSLAENHWRGNVSLQMRVQRILTGGPWLTRQTYGRVYSMLRRRSRATVVQLCEALPDLSVGQLQLILTTFVELGFAGQVGSAYHVVERPNMQDLRESACYRTHLYAEIAWD